MAFADAGRALERLLREAKLARRLKQRYGTRFPEVVELPETGLPLAIDPRDRRARKQVLFDGLRGRIHRNARFWRDACRYYQPDVAIDVGANFGECGLGERYPQGTRVLVLEANPTLMPYLERSRQLHPDAERIEVIHTLVDAQPGEPRPLYVSQASSGQSSAAGALADTAGFVASAPVPVQSVDALLAERGLTPARLVFKIDVEGYEPRVLAGMRGALTGATLAVGYLEFDSEFLERAGVSLADYDALLEGAALYEVSGGSAVRLARVASLAALTTQYAGATLHTDLLVLWGTDDVAPFAAASA